MNSFYAVCKFLIRSYMRAVFRIQIDGLEHIPPTGPVVLVSNHVSNWDPLLLGIVSPRQIHFMAKDALFRIPVIGSIMRAWGMFPVKRGAADRNAIRTAIQLLEENRVLGIFPEGHRSRTGELGPFLPGAVSIALKGNAAVVPFAITGPYRLFRTVRVRIGPAVDLESYRSARISSAVLDEASNVIRNRIASLLDSVRAVS